MKQDYDLNRFVDAQRHSYEGALAEIRGGRKVSHWMWYIFPQLRGLGRSYMAEFYGIEDLQEARALLNHPQLGARLREISGALLRLPGSDAVAVMGWTDAMKLRSSMTLFRLAAPGEPVFAQVLEKYFGGETDRMTEELISRG